MRWPAFLNRFRRPPVEEQLRAFDEQLERNLASRKADRAARQERSRRGASTKVRKAYERDALLREQVRL
jgi:hypothetical protein